jgi:hypothetical protein
MTPKRKEGDTAGFLLAKGGTQPVGKLICCHPKTQDHP